MAATMASTIQYTLARPCTYWSAQPGAAWTGSVSYLKKGLSLSSHILPNWICFLNFRHPQAASVQGAGVLPAAGVSSSSSGRVLGCIVTWEKWSGIYWASLCRLCPATVQHWQLHRPSIPDVFSVSTAQSTLTLFTIARLDIWCRYYVVHISTRLLLQPEPEWNKLSF